MKYCKRCVMPDTRPDIVFNEEGICDPCVSTEKKNKEVNWEERKQKFEEIVNKYKSKSPGQYDCVIPVSGGKDSTYQVYVMTKVYGLKPLCVCFEPTIPTKIGLRNLRNLNRMGVDLIHFKKNPVAYKKLVRKGLERVGDNEWPNHAGIFTVPVNMALKFKIPLIIWGENPQLEYGGPVSSRESKVLDRRWLEEFGGLLGNRVEDMIDEDVSLSDLKPYIYPSDEEIKEVGVTGVFLGYFFPWDSRNQIKIIKKECNWKSKGTPMEGSYTDFEDLDCHSMVIHEYLKHVKYGFGRGTDHACTDIRKGRMSREEAVKLVNEHDGKIPEEALKAFLKYLKISREEFFKMIEPFTNNLIFKKDEKGNFLRDKLYNLIKKDEYVLR